MLLIDRRKPNGAIRFKVSSFNQLNAIVRVSYRKDVYVAVYCESCRQKQVFNRIYIDLDKSPEKIDLQQTLEEARKIAELFPCDIYFTGNKGFAVYIYFDFIHLEHPRETMRHFVEMLEKHLNLKTIDWHVIGDLKRVSRLPFTINQKTGNFCIPVNPNWSLDKILELSRNPLQIEPLKQQPSKFVYKLLEGIDRHVTEQEKELIYTPPKNPDLYRQQVQKLIEVAPKIKDGRHRLMFHGIIPRLVLVNATDEEILATCKEFITRTGKDWNEYCNYVKRAIKHTRNRVAKGEPLKYNFATVLVENPELIEFFKEER